MVADFSYLVYIKNKDLDFEFFFTEHHAQDSLATGILKRQVFFLPPKGLFSLDSMGSAEGLQLSSEKDYSIIVLSMEPTPSKRTRGIQEAIIQIKHDDTDWVQVGKRVRQGCILLPYLINLSAE